jgi:hypothetical protein
MSTLSPHLSAESLDLMLLDSLPSAEDAKAMAHLSTCPGCRGEWEERLEHKSHFLQSVLPRQLAAMESRHKKFDLLGWWQFFVPVTAVAVAIAAVIVVRTGGAARDLGIKGGPALEVFAKRGDVVFAVKPGVKVAAGDRLRFVVEGARTRYLLIASIDGAARVCQLFPAPASKADSEAIEAGRNELPGSVELDDAPGPERVYAFFTEAPIMFSAAEAAIRAAPENPVVDGISPLRMSLVKEVR